jgi:AraC family transcriptional regulator
MEKNRETYTTYQERINIVLNYIQKNIDKPLSLEKLAKVALISKFHFCRIFNAFVGESIGCYIRRLKLEQSAKKLLYSKKRVTEIALDAGYSTLSSFAKAFVKFFGCSPSKFRSQKETYLFCKKEQINFEKRKEISVDYRIEIIKPKKVVYVRRTGAYLKSAPEAFSVIMQFVCKNQLIKNDSECIGVCYNDPKITDVEKIMYDACVTIDQDIKPQGEIGVQTIAGGKYVIFSHQGPYETLGEAYSYIYSNWLSENKKIPRDIPVFEKYLNSPQTTKPKDLKTEIYIPIE